MVSEDVVLPEILVKYPLPQVICDECGKLCVYKRYANSSDGEAWLECTVCGRKWEDIGHAILEQDEMIDGIASSAKDISANAKDGRNSIRRRVVEWYKSL